MSTIEIDLVKTLATAAEDAYLDPGEGALLLTPGYALRKQHSDPNTGFSITVLEKPGSHEYILAFRGTEGASAQDWYTNLTLGTSQWNKNSGRVAELIAEIEGTDPGAKLHFTGHSLGGALAQYAAYSYAAGDNSLAFDLVTFNALGGELALKNSMVEGIAYDPAKGASVNAAHFAIVSDPVSRLGDGHIGGELLIIQKPTDSPLNAHPIAQFTGYSDGYTPVSDTQYGLATPENNYLSIYQPVLASGIIASLGDDGDYSAAEATLRTISALGFGLAQASATDLGEIVAALVGDEQKLGSMTYGALEFTAGVAVGRFQASKQASLATRGIGAYALTVANLLQASTEFWAEHPGLADVTGMSLEDFISDVARPALDIAGKSLDAALQYEISAEAHSEALQDFAHTREWVAAFDPSIGGNQLYVQGSESGDSLQDHGSIAWWESEGTRLYGYSGDDTISAGAGGDYLDGGPGNDTLDAGSGDDLLQGAEGDDLLQGGSGEDVYIHTAGHGQDLIDDADRTGVILLKNGRGAGGYISLAGHQRHAGGSTWSDDANFSWNGSGADLEITWPRLGLDSSVTVRNFHNGDYGIYLTGATASGHNRQFGLSDTPNTLVGGPGHDQLYGHSLGDTLVGGGGDDELYGADGDDQLDGGEGHDQLFGSYGDDILLGGPGSDQLFGGEGYDILDGGDGNDEIFTSAGNDSVNGGPGADEIFGGEGAESLRGGPGSDLIFGEGDADWIQGEQGVDFIAGGPGADLLEGGDGHDIYHYAPGDGYDTIVDTGSNTLEFGAGLRIADMSILESAGSLYINTGSADDTVEIRGYAPSTPRSSSITRFSFADGSYLAIEDLNLVANRIDPVAVIGDELDNQLRGTWAPEEIVMGPGNDIAEGGGGHDTYIFGLGDGEDTIVDAGENTLRFGAGITMDDLTLRTGSLRIQVGTAGDEVRIQGFDPDDPQANIAISDFQFADGGFASFSEVLALGLLQEGTPADDQISGTASPDRLLGKEGSDTLAGLAGNDLLYGNQGNDLLEGGPGADRLYGGRHGDALDGGEGDDRLRGGAGEDTLLGSGGNDVMNGGRGNDRYVFGPGDGRDIIRNNDANTDSLDILEMQYIAHDELWLSRRKDHLVIDLVGTDDRIRIHNWYASPDNQVDIIQAGSHALAAEQVDALVHAMAAFDAPAGVGAVIPETTMAELAPTLVTSWHATG